MRNTKKIIFFLISFIHCVEQGAWTPVSTVKECVLNQLDEPNLIKIDGANRPLTYMADWLSQPEGLYAI